MLREHVGPFIFASTALTSLMLLQYVAKKFGDLVGKGLPARVIAEFLGLSVPFTVAMTLPMAVLVAVLYAFSRLAAENEITALKASGVGMRSILGPVLVGGALLSLVHLWFLDFVLPASNHRLAVLTLDIFRTKPTFALREQVINPVKEGQLYLRANHIDEATSWMKDVVIYDLSDPAQRRTIYADSGTLSLAPNRTDLEMTLYHGVMQQVPNKQPGQLSRLFYRNERLRVPGVFTSYQESNAGAVSKGDREMSICEMQQELARADFSMRTAQYDGLVVRNQRLGKPRPRPPLRDPRGPGIGRMYCSVLDAVMPSSASAQASQAPQQQPQLPARTRFNTARPTQVPGRPGFVPPAASQPDTSVFNPANPAAQQAVHASSSAGLPIPAATARPVPGTHFSTQNPHAFAAEIQDAQFRVDEARRERNRYDVEIHKKFSLAAACIIFVLVGAPIALRFPRGGVGLVIGVSFGIFGLYYVGLIGGEALADKALLPPWLAMWAANIVLLIAGLILVARMGRESATSRGGEFGELMAALRARLGGWMRRLAAPLERGSA